MNQVADILTGVLTVAIVGLLVRPKSQGPALLQSFGSSYASVLTAAEGGSW